MSDLTITLIGAAVFCAGYVVGHIHALVSDRRGGGWND